MKSENEWNTLSELLSNLIVKYADALDIDSMPNPEISYKNTDISQPNAKDNIAKRKIT
ncbi:hypothetical protein [Anaerotignum sp.]|uniref:hypothetical protein n=1 Tax=Anaerotignum sp. TaxID=2039241 RepID=UPI0028AF80A2|nr:hypothetical protein [Anaerotignum sp.]